MRSSLVFHFLSALIVSSAYSAFGIGILLPRVPEHAPIQLADAEVRVDIKQNIAKTRVVQNFFNPNPRQLEADFYFPVPRGANVTDFVLYMNGKPVKGEVLEKEKAREIYEGIVRRMKDPGLLEWMDHNLFKVRVFPVPANGTQKIELEFAQPLEADQGMFKYTFPLKTPKTGPERTGQDIAKIDFSVSISGDSPIRNVYSPSHPIDADSSNPKNVRVALPGKSLTGLTGDFVLYYETSDKEISAGFLAHKMPAEDGFFSLMLSPPVKTDSQTSTPSDFLFVFDTSGSMLEDNKIDQARRALNYCISQLGAQDRFNIIRFSTEVEKFRENLIPAARENLDAAKSWVKDLPARGGTNISGALAEAFSTRDLQTSSGRICTIVFMTDGQPTVGTVNVDQIIDQVKSKNGANLRLFTFGVGNDVNTKLLDRVAEETRAVSEYIRPQQDMEVIIGKFFDKISRPAMTGLRLDLGPAQTYDIYPKELPDLFFGTQLTVFGRYKKAAPAAVKLNGNVAGKPVELVFEKTFPENEPENTFVEKLWGTRKIGYLLDEIRAHGENTELKTEVISLAKKYGVATPYTSFLVAEDKDMEAVRAPVHTMHSPVQTLGGPRAADATRNPMPSSSGGVTSFDQGSVQRAEAPAAAKRAQESRATGFSANFKEESGAGAVRYSTELRDLKKAVQASVQSAAKTAWNRSFSYTDGFWTDETIGSSGGEIIRVKGLSKAYFDLITLQPALTEVFALGDRVRVKVGATIIEVSPDAGLEELSEAQKDLVRKN